MPMAPSWQALAHRPQPLHFSSLISMIRLTILSTPLFLGFQNFLHLGIHFLTHALLCVGAPLDAA
jgi:hypothetical protein